MLWLFAAIGGYGMTALSGVADKFLVSGRIEKPVVYVVLLTLFSLVSFVLAPFGLQVLPPMGMAIFLVSGILFAWSLLFLFTAFRTGEVSRILPLVGIFSAIVTLLPSVVRIFISGEIPISGFLSFFLLLGGAALLSLSGSNGQMYSRRDIVLSLLSGVFLAGFYLLIKFGEGSGANFVSGLIWSRFGVFLGGMLLLLVPAYRRDVMPFLSKKIPSRKAMLSRPALLRGNTLQCRQTGTLPTWLIFISGKTLGGIGAILIIFATYRGPVAIVQALVGVQFAFVFLIALLLSGRFPTIFSERLSHADWLRKAGAFVCISIGMWLSVRGEISLF
ncbi:MAG: hypothetical protein WAU31_02780 [Candidatus Moraniibacteriota bacterium]